MSHCLVTDGVKCKKNGVEFIVYNPLPLDNFKKYKEKHTPDKNAIL